MGSSGGGGGFSYDFVQHQLNMQRQAALEQQKRQAAEYERQIRELELKRQRD
jgi:hypothetical protein